MRSLLVLCILPALSAAALVGGKTDIDLKADDPNVLFALSAINTFYTQQGDNAARQLVKVESATSQVVAGTQYHLVLRVYSGSEEELCEVSVWSRPWLSGDEATQISHGPACKPAADAMTKTPLAGGENAIDPQSSEVMNALNFAVDMINLQMNSLYLSKASKVPKVTSQVVSGIVYHFYGVEMARTECMKSSNQELSTCNVATDANAFVSTCDFDVWWQSWMTPEYKFENLTCK